MNETQHIPSPSFVDETSPQNRFEQFGGMLSHDFCPGLNRYVYWLKRPIGWVICGAIISGLAGLAINTQGFVFMWSFIAFLVFGTVWPWLVIKGTRCELVFDSNQSQENQDTTVTLKITNYLPLPVFGVSIEGAFLQDIYCDEDKVMVALKRLPARSVSNFRWTFKPQKRGIIPGESPKIVTGFPFGIQHFEREISVDNSIIVWPEALRLESVPSLSGSNFNIAGRMSDRTGTEGDYVGARHYRQGDSLRQVNWKLSARRNRLVVLERQSAAQQPIRIFLDLNPEIHTGSGSQSSYEWAIRTASTVCKQFHLNQSCIELTCVGMPTDVPYSCSNQKGLSHLLNFLSLLPERDDLLARIKEQVSVRNIEQYCNARGLDKTYIIGTSDSNYSSVLQSLPNAVVFEFGSDGPHQFGTRDTVANKNVITLSTQKTSAELTDGWERLCADA